MHDAGATSRPCCGDIVNRLCAWFATGLGVGFVAPAPGTIGGLWGLLLVPVVASQPCLSCQLWTASLLIALAMFICERARLALDDGKDPQCVALDEIVALPLVYVMQGPLTWRLVAVGFILFRVCDILKPPPARQAERLPGGVGIVADDLVAAGWAWLALRGLVRLDSATGVDWLAATSA